MTDQTTGFESEGLSTPKDDFFLEWGREQIKGTPPALNASLQHIITIDVALVGGGLAAAGSDTLPGWWGVGAVALVFLSLAVSLWGVYPVGRRVRWRVPADIERFAVETIRRKQRSMFASFVLLVAALGVVVLYLLVSQLDATLNHVAAPPDRIDFIP